MCAAPDSGFMSAKVFSPFRTLSPLPRTASLHHKNGKDFQSLLHSVLQLSLVAPAFGLMHSCRHFSSHTFPRSPCILVNSYNNGPV